MRKWGPRVEECLVFDSAAEVEQELYPKCLDPRARSSHVDEWKVHVFVIQIALGLLFMPLWAWISAIQPQFPLG